MSLICDTVALAVAAAGLGNNATVLLLLLLKENGIFYLALTFTFPFQNLFFSIFLVPQVHLFLSKL